MRYGTARWGRHAGRAAEIETLVVDDNTTPTTDMKTKTKTKTKVFKTKECAILRGTIRIGVSEKLDGWQLDEALLRLKDKNDQHFFMLRIQAGCGRASRSKMRSYVVGIEISCC